MKNANWPVGSDITQKENIFGSALPCNWTPALTSRAYRPRLNVSRRAENEKKKGKKLAELRNNFFLESIYVV